MTHVRRLPGPNADLWDWQLHAACRGMDVERFYHPDNERGPRRRAREQAALAVCAECPVVRECARHALVTREPYGIWGGLTEGEREDILTGRTPPPPWVEPAIVA